MTAKIFKALGLAAGLGVAAMPLASYAVDPATADAAVNVTINPVISMSLDADSTSVSMDPNTVNLTTLSTTAKVSTNAQGGYKLTLADKDTDTNLVHTTLTNFKIGTSTATPAAGTASWAVKGGNISSWTAMPASNGTALTLKSATALTSAVITDEETTVTYGVGLDSSLASGTYTDTVTFTATAAE